MASVPVLEVFLALLPSSSDKDPYVLAKRAHRIASEFARGANDAALEAAQQAPAPLPEAKAPAAPIATPVGGTPEVKA